MFRTVLLIIVGFFSWILYTDSRHRTKLTTLPALPTVQVLKQAAWVDSVFGTLSEDQKIGQLFMVAAYSSGAEMNAQRIERLINEYHLGGIIFSKGDPLSQANLTNFFQKITKVPLLIGMDAEYGLGMRLRSVIDLPQHMTMGAVTDPRLAYQMGAQIAKQCRRLGVHLNFGPVVDVNSNPMNPIIGQRAFGESRENVTRKGIAYMKGMQHNGVIACAKHFPGHGDTQDDSHYNLPVISHGGDRLESVELYPFRQLIADSVMSVLVGHLQVPYYDNKPATVSEKIVTRLLKNEMGFQGLVFTDALNMKGITRIVKPGELEVQALQAGNDVLLFSESMIEAVRRIKEALQNGQLSQVDIDTKVKKILKAKYFAGLSKWKPIDTQHLQNDLNDVESQLFNHRVYEQAATVVKNQQSRIPFTHLDTTRFVSVAIGADADNAFQRTLSNYASFRHYTIGKSEEQNFTALLARLDTARLVVVSLHQMSYSPRRNFGVSRTVQDFVTRLQEKTNVVLCVFGSPYALKFFEETPTILCAYEDADAMQSAVAQVLFGALPAKGKLPVSAGNFVVGTGIRTEASGRLAYSFPESVGLSSVKLQKIDQVVGQAIGEQAFPGCQVLVARRGKVVYRKNFGRQSYDNILEPVKDNTVYDLASVTKVAATLQTVMLLHERKLLQLTEKASSYLPELKSTNKENLTIEDILLHRAGLVAYIPFWERTVSRSDFKPIFYASSRSDTYPHLVADSLYASVAMRDSVWKWVIKSPLTNRRDRDGGYPFVYSDLGLMILQKVVERLTNQTIDDFVQQNFYEPLGMNRTGFNPLTRGLSRWDIAPTEHDNAFRERRLRGTVQDQQAAMLGGVSGHAGLFSNSNDLAILMQMNLQLGYYGSHRYFMPSTLPAFTQVQGEKGHRGLGWDKRPDDGQSNYVSDRVSLSSYGHSGYTGTMVWADPEQELVFVFLSNRVHPNASNNKINTLKVRRRVQDAVYEAIME